MHDEDLCEMCGTVRATICVCGPECEIRLCEGCNREAEEQAKRLRSKSQA